MAGTHGIEQLRKAVDLDASASMRERLESWFLQRWPERRDNRLDNLTVPAEGISNSMLVFDVYWREADGEQGGRFVARLEPDDEPVAPKMSTRYAHSVVFEYQMHDLVGRHSQCPVAPLVGLETSSAVLGRPFYVMTHVPGRVPPAQGPMLKSFLVDEASPGQRRCLVESGLDALIALHRIDWRSLQLDWLDPSAGGPYRFAPQLERYREIALRHLRGLEHPLLISTIDWLRDNEPADLEPALVWGDSRPGNILFGQDYRVAAALDWELGAIMPRDSDMALWLLTDFMVHESEGAARLPGYPTREEQAGYYEKHGRPLHDLAYWEIFTAMKIAYVFVRVVRRMQDKGAMPPDQDGLIFDNFAVRFLREHAGQKRSSLITDSRRSAR